MSQVYMQSGQILRHDIEIPDSQIPNQNGILLITLSFAVLLLVFLLRRGK